MSSADETSWFLAGIRPNCSRAAQENLARQAFNTFMPMETVTRRTSRGFSDVRKPLFPGYIFVQTSLSDPRWRSINSTYGVTRLVSFGGYPSRVPVGFVEELRLRCDAEGRLIPNTEFKPGDVVTVASGPFAQFLAEVESVAADRRVWILLELMGGKTKVLYPQEQLKAV